MCLYKLKDERVISHDLMSSFKRNLEVLAEKPTSKMELSRNMNEGDGSPNEWVSRFPLIYP